MALSLLVGAFLTRNQRTCDSDNPEVDVTILKDGPAHLRLNPRHAGTKYWLKGLPRMRGDRPQTDHTVPALTMATPHARGSTQSGRTTS